MPNYREKVPVFEVRQHTGDEDKIAAWIKDRGGVSETIDGKLHVAGLLPGSFSVLHDTNWIVLGNGVFRVFTDEAFATLFEVEK